MFEKSNSYFFLGDSVRRGYLEFISYAYDGETGQNQCQQASAADILVHGVRRLSGIDSSVDQVVGSSSIFYVQLYSVSFLFYVIILIKKIFYFQRFRRRRRFDE